MEELECTCDHNCCSKNHLLGIGMAVLGFGIVLTGHIFMCKKRTI